MLGDGEPVEEPATLGDVDDPSSRPLGGRNARDVAPGEGDVPAHGTDEPRDDPQRRRLARSVRAEEGDDFALADGQPDVADHCGTVVAGCQALDAEEGVGHDASITGSSSAAAPPRYAEITRGVAADDVGRAVGDDLPELEHDHVVGDPEHEPHVVVDQEHRRPRVDHFTEMAGQLFALPGVEACRRLVQAEEPWLRGERARDPDELALSLREILGHGVGRRLEAQERQGRICRLGAPDRPGERLDRRRPRRRAVRGDGQVLAHAQVVEQLERLPRPRQPALGAGVCRKPVRLPPVQLDPPFVGQSTPRSRR